MARTDGIMARLITRGILIAIVSAPTLPNHSAIGALVVSSSA